MKTEKGSLTTFKRNAETKLKDSCEATEIIELSRSFCFEVRKNLRCLILIVGIHEGHSRHRLANIHNLVVICILAFSTLRRAFQINLRPPGVQPLSWRDAAFDPHIVLSFTRVLFNLSGFLTAILCRLTRKHREAYYSAIDDVIGDSQEAINKGKRMTKKLIVFTISFVGVVGTMEMLNQLRVYRNHYIPPLITDSQFFIPFEVYNTLLAQSSITLTAVEFCQSCNFLRMAVGSVSRLMHDNKRLSTKEAKLKHLDEVQVLHHKVVIAKHRLEKCYAFVVFCFYACAIPTICFLAYVAYRNVEGHSSLISTIGIWIMVVIMELLLLSSPAFLLHEEGESLLTDAFDMYHANIKGESDQTIMMQMQVLIAQIKSTKIAISAYNYFPLNRQIVITIFSAVFTYFLILVQFSGDQTKHCGPTVEDVANVSLQFQ